ncbi:hypothetical protein HOU45_gp57 [Microbacterium phage Armstrong]|uniref:Uncharacterized protein n=2 Tax=Armstrongvirus armstrong TaxID=2734217 RepID=A0A3G2KD61_9CAUD|nr:hypothetical protein HOU45_gp57 [Microbacterium phage Armstrong]AYN56942.1 hypothetical protein PBI_ARMSTRONG_57 [Microbacterium phage Armstrong]QED11480.1 hypothetical protein SEA_VITAS_57 [Microbacterium phage Vitas]
MATITDSIRAAVDAAKGPEDLTVVRFAELPDRGEAQQEAFMRNEPWPDEPRPLTYAALYVAGRWYITGTKGPADNKVVRHQAFMERLAGDRVTFAEVAISWEVAK